MSEVHARWGPRPIRIRYCTVYNLFHFFDSYNLAIHVLDELCALRLSLSSVGPLPSHILDKQLLQLLLRTLADSTK